MKLLVVSIPGSYDLFVEFATALNAQALLQLPAEFHLAHAFTGSAVWIVSGLFTTDRARHLPTEAAVPHRAPPG